MYSDASIKSSLEEESSSNRHSNVSLPMSPYRTSPWTSHTNPFIIPPDQTDLFPSGTGLIASLIREEGHIYSLATFNGLLYTGSDSKNIRVWKNMKEFTGFKSSSGLVKAIVISPKGQIFTGHQDGKIRTWKISLQNPQIHARLGTLPRLKDYIKSTLSRRKIRHSDAVSCLALDDINGFLYSGSWDRSLKLWRVSDSRCLDSVNAHDDAVNSVIIGFDGFVFSGSADGTVKVWRVEPSGKSQTGRRVVEVAVLVRQESAVTALGVSLDAGVLYCGSSDGRVSFWGRNLVRGGILNGHKFSVLCLALAGDLVFTGSADKAICVWGREENGTRHVWLSVLTGHEGPVKCLAVEEDVNVEEAVGGRRWVVYSGSLDKSIKVWKVTDFVGWEGGRRSGFLSCSSNDDPIFDAF
ncbi:hypothetical protein KFK09_025631 [Dendrobium nobile]|uniref:Uncharacterized protein n=1 Tax=Dendrobium nobile TaxID=94219 RepID=A0A8T3A650_DENNO|nr:hypothetical protein KFK09_025631 [Dendrobium nobile]